MKRNLQDIDKLFKDGLEDHLEPAPAGIWDAVNNDLDKKQAIAFKEKYTRLKKLSLVLLLFIFSGMASLVYFVKAGKTNGMDQTQMVTSNEKEGANTKSKATAADSKSSKNEMRVAEETLDTKQNKLAGDVHDANVTKAPGTEPTDAENKATENKGVQQSLPVEIGATNQSSLANKTNGLHTQAAGKNVTKDRTGSVSNSHAKQRIQQQPIAGNGSNEALTQQPNRVNTDKKTAGDIAREEMNTGNNYQLPGAKRLITSIHGNNQSSIAASSQQQSEILFSPYADQAPLMLPAISEAMPGPLVAMEQAPFLQRVVQSDSLKKAMALGAKKMVAKHPVSLSVFVSPNHSFTRLENDLQLAGPGRDKKMAERDERQGASFSAGVLINYGLSKSLILQSGLVFSSAKTNISPKVIYARPDIYGHTRYEFNCASGYSYITPKGAPTPTVGDSIQAIGSSSTISYIGVPVSVNYVWQRGRFLLKPGVGFSVNFLTGGNSSTTLHTVSNQKENTSAVISGLRKAYVDASVGFGAELMLSRKLSFGIRPQLRMALTSINKNTPIKTYQNFLSFETGLRINL